VQISDIPDEEAQYREIDRLIWTITHLAVREENSHRNSILTVDKSRTGIPGSDLWVLYGSYRMHI
jgi:hypothetical protein